MTLTQVADGCLDRLIVQGHCPRPPLCTLRATPFTPTTSMLPVLFCTLRGVGRNALLLDPAHCTTEAIFGDAPPFFGLILD